MNTTTKTYNVSCYTDGSYHLTTRHHYNNNDAYERMTGNKVENHDHITAEEVNEITKGHHVTKLNYCPVIA